MNTERNEKKSETIKVRVPWSLKRDFLAKARREGRPASALFREYMEDYLRRPARPKPTLTLETAMTTIRKHPRPAFAAVLGAAGASALLTSVIPAGAAPDLRAEFRALDANGDGAVTMDELEGAIKVDALIIPRDAADGHPMARAMLLPPSGEPGERRVLAEMAMPPGGEAQLFDPAMLNAHVLEIFARGDNDGDGLSLEEFIASNEWLRAQSFASLDANQDGVLDPGEMIAVDGLDEPAARQARAALAEMDANGDGRVTRAEYDDAV